MQLLFYLTMFFAFVSFWTINSRITNLEKKYTLLLGMIKRIQEMKKEEFE